MRSSTPRGFHGTSTSCSTLGATMESAWELCASSWVQLVSLGLLGGLALLGDPLGLREKIVREVVGVPGGTV